MMLSFPQITKVTQGARKQRKGSKEDQNLNKLKEICTLSRFFFTVLLIECGKYLVLLGQSYTQHFVKVVVKNCWARLLDDWYHVYP